MELQSVLHMELQLEVEEVEESFLDDLNSLNESLNST
jgi:hypothetical protein